MATLLDSEKVKTISIKVVFVVQLVYYIINLTLDL